MGLKDSLLGMMGDFVQMNKNPEFRSKTEISKAGTSDNLNVPNLKQRRHSLNITVGAQGPPDTFVRPRTYSIKVKKEDRHSPIEKSEEERKKETANTRRYSAPPGHFNYHLDSSKKNALKKQKSLEKSESDSSDSENDIQKRKMIPIRGGPSGGLGSSGYFRPGSFRETAPIEEEPEDYSNSYNNSGITIITTKF